MHFTSAVIHGGKCASFAEWSSFVVMVRRSSSVSVGISRPRKPLEVGFLEVARAVAVHAN